MIPNLISSAFSEPVYPWAVQGTLILDIYVNRVLGGLGVLVNLFFVILLSHRTLKHKIYDYLWCRQFTSLIACLPLAVYNGLCFSCDFNSEWLAYFTFFDAVTIRAFSLASFISDILLISNRFFEIIRKTTFLKRLSKTLILLISFSFSLIVISPCYFVVYVTKDPSNGVFKSYLNQFGSSVYFKVYFFVLFLLETVVPLFTQSYFNIVSTVKFKHLMARHADLTGNQVESREAEAHFTRMILLFSVITSLTRLIDLVTTTLYRISFISPSTFDQGTLELLVFSKSCSVIVINLTLAFDALVYLRMDKKIWGLIRSLTGNRVINLSLISRFLYKIKLFNLNHLLGFCCWN